jgi:hypothetical protein
LLLSNNTNNTNNNSLVSPTAVKSLNNEASGSTSVSHNEKTMLSEANLKETSSLSSVFLFSDDSGQSHGQTPTNATFFEPKHLVIDLDSAGGNNTTGRADSTSSNGILKLTQNDSINLDEFKSFIYQTNTGYCVDSVEPKCSELKRLIDEFKVNYLSKLNRFKSNKCILQRLNNVSDDNDDDDDDDNSDND